MEFKVPEADAEENGIWCAAEASNAGGIYKTVTQTADGKKTITLTGVFKYDESAGDGVAISRIVSLYALDTFGNQSAVQTFSISAINEKPAYISGVYDSTNGFTADFTAPVILTDPAESLSALSTSR